MVLDVEKYRRIFEPRSIFDLLPAPFIQTLIKGFFHTLNTGVAFFPITYGEQNPPWTIGDPISPFNLDLGDDRAHFNKVCLKYRDGTEGGRPGCVECDKTNIKRIVAQNQKNDSTYNCWLGFAEFPYPLVIAGRILAVILTGQCFPRIKAPEKPIKESITKEIGEGQIDEGLGREMIGLIADEMTRQNKLDRDYYGKVQTNLRDFGKVLQEIIDRLYQETRNAAGNALIKDVAGVLADYPMDDFSAWRRHCGEVLEDFKRITDVDRIEVYTRHEYAQSAKHFERVIPEAAGEEETYRIRTRDVMPFLPKHQLVGLDFNTPEHRRLLKRLPHPERPVFMYRHSTDGAKNLTTLMVLYNVPSSVGELSGSFCETFCGRFAISSLISLIRAEKDQHERKVGIAAHSLRTPLQCFQLDIDALGRHPCVQEDIDLRGRLEETQGRIIDAQEDIRALLEDLRPSKTTCDFVEIVEEAINYLDPLAEKHPCGLVRQSAWPAQAMVYIDRRKIRIAIMDLIQNAIKYSYKGSAKEQRLHEVRISVTIKDIYGNLFVMISVSNYGIGIPPKLCVQLNFGHVSGERAEIPDVRGSREGTGWGLLSAFEAFEDCEGWIEIDSRPADKFERLPGQEYHRYVTTVRAYLPIQGVIE